MGRYLLEARRLGLSRGRTTILTNVSLGLHAGELGVLLGPSGSGKSTTLKALGGLLRPDSGEVFVRDRRLGDLTPAELASNIGSVPQDDIIHTGLRLRRALEYAAELRFPASASARDIRHAVDRVLEDVDLSERARVRIKRLSGGQRKRASLALELLMAPAVLLLDEPTSGLDPHLEKTTMALLRRLAGQGRAVLVTTHATASVDLADFLLVIAGGYLVWAGPPDQALRHFSVADPIRIFDALRGVAPSVWASRYAGSRVARAFAERPSPMGRRS